MSLNLRFFFTVLGGSRVSMDESPDFASSQVFAKVEGTLLTEAPTDLYIPPEALQVFLETFEGPLDLLLYLIKKQNHY